MNPGLVHQHCRGGGSHPLVSRHPGARLGVPNLLLCLHFLEQCSHVLMWQAGGTWSLHPESCDSTSETKSFSCAEPF